MPGGDFGSVGPLVANKTVAEVVRLRKNKGQVDQNAVPLDVTVCEIWKRTVGTELLPHNPKSHDFGYESYCNAGVGARWR